MVLCRFALSLQLFFPYLIRNSLSLARTLIYIRQRLYLRRGNGVMFSPLTDVAQATVRHKAEGGFDEVS